ncbi:MG2 domain-containing protein [Mucilaginibacter sp. FT3.2]|uniref:MG2 domain-containing protein n=1 Tax=Mucilaginibacter sp. FT3.2 TaxID=2723090 RepID=UPI0016190722|nr:MG2 domain-containing protein [Mucilaginibacter sp. FT3.2]MBB6229698.1 hypothetical protein [Mucilaginibacter sp. FT3.2]
MKKIVFAFLCTACIYTSAFSQDAKTVNFLDNIVSRLQTLSSTKATEKVYLQFDRGQYNAGDTVFFKAYLTLGEQHQLSKLSGVVHVALLNTLDSLVQNISLQATNGLAWGDFALPNGLPMGVYHIRAYTQWMLNSTDPYIFDQLVLVNSKVPAMAAFTGKPAATTNKFDIQFFAEGGAFVNDIPAKLAFKAVDHNGIGIDVKGVVIDNLNTEVTKFEAKHLGMGLINITPVEGRTYKAKLVYADGTKATVDLPKADDKGITLLVNNDNPEKLMIEINANRPYFLANKNKEIGITIYSGGGTVRSVKTTLDDQVLDLNLAKKDFQTGIARVTVFSQTGEPMNERLVFIQNNDLLNLQTSSDKPAYATRGKVHIAISAKKDDKPVAGYFSAAVTDVSKVPVNESAETTILTSLLLTSELKGFIEQPSYYFANVSNDTRSNLDILMLTQGYRRFEWKQLLGNDVATFPMYPAEKGLNLSGVVKTNNGTPVANGNVTLLTKSGGTMLNQETDANGRFTFANLIYADNTPFMIQAKTSEGKNNIKIIMDPLARVAITAHNTPAAGTDATPVGNNKKQPKDLYMADASGTLLKEVIVKDKKYLDPEHASQTVSGSQIKDQTSISTGLNGRLNGVTLRGGVPYLSDKVSPDMQGGPMLIVLDEITLGEGASVDDYNISDVESVKVLKNIDAAIYGVRGSNGVLVIKTHKSAGLVVSKEMAPGLLSYAPKGFYKARTFYSPVYGGSGSQNNIPDMRSTIYWNPDIVTDKDGGASFDFYNADGKGSYRVVVEGIDENGNLGRSVYTYKVE